MKRTGPLRRMAFIGPGIVYALQIQGTADFVSNAAAGASYGYALIWALGLTLVLRFVWVNTSAKYVLVTGETLSQGYAHLGTWVLWVVLVVMLVSKHFYNLYLILIMGGAADLLFPLPSAWSAALWSLFFTGIGFGLMFWGGYPAVERLCKVLMAVMGAGLVMAALRSNPDPAGIARGMLVPTIPGSEGLYDVFFLLMALVGTEAGAMGNLTYAYYIHQRGWRDVSWIRRQRVDLGFGVLCLFLTGMLVQVSAAGSVLPLGVELEGTEDLVRIFSETLGLLGLIVFALGLWGATFSTFVGSTMGFALVVTDICHLAVGRFKGTPVPADIKRDPVYRALIVFWSFSPLYILITGVRPVWLVLVVNALVVVAVPVLALALVKITNDGKLMGRYKNSLWTNSVLLFLVGVSIYFAGKNGATLLGRLLGP